jgi:ribose 1,5-bisphosphokinase
MKISPAAAKPIGPGRLILVVGPSGAGKDTLIAGAKTLSRTDSTIVFPRRIVTRAASDAEAHDSLSEAAFDDASAQGMFAFWWQAHGHKYALPRTVDQDIGAGRTVICNVSRAIVPQLRKDYRDVRAVLVTAPIEILQKRLSARTRTSDGPVEQRMARNDAFAAFVADATVENSGTAQEGSAKLFEIIRSPAAQQTRVADADHRR